MSSRRSREVAVLGSYSSRSYSQRRSTRALTVSAVVLAVLGSIAACGDSSSSEPNGADTTGKDAASGTHSDAGTPPTGQDGSSMEKDAEATDAGDDGSVKEKGPPPSSLPVTFTRPDVGTPLTPAELEAA